MAEIIKFNLILFLVLNATMYLLHLRDIKKDKKAYPIWIPFSTALFVQFIVNVAIIITTFVI